MLSLFFLHYAYQQLVAFRAQWESASASPATMLYAAVVPNLVRHGLLLLNFALVGILLLLSRTPSVPPASAPDVLVPLVANFFYLTYNFADLAPAGLTRNLLPTSWRLTLSSVALYLGALAVALATWAVAHLGRSFGLLISVRPLVRAGPYRYVRHPMYSSYLLFPMTSLVITHGSILVFVLALAHLLLTVYRARLEEARLSEHSPAYREYMGRTGFLFPKWNRRRVLSSASA